MPENFSSPEQNREPVNPATASTHFRLQDIIEENKLAAHPGEQDVLRASRLVDICRKKPINSPLDQLFFN